MVYMIESQIAYVMDALTAAGDADASRCGRRSRRAYHAEIAAPHAGHGLEHGCTSWYQDAKGNNPTLWPDWTWRFRRRTARFDPAEYMSSDREPSARHRRARWRMMARRRAERRGARTYWLG